MLREQRARDRTTISFCLLSFSFGHGSARRRLNGATGWHARRSDSRLPAYTTTHHNGLHSSPHLARRKFQHGPAPWRSSRFQASWRSRLQF